jgi:hypothetical protein
MKPTGNNQRILRLLRECNVSAIPALLLLATCFWLVLWPPLPQQPSPSVPPPDVESMTPADAPAA